MRVLMTVGLVMALTGSAMAQGAAELKVGDMAPEFSLQGTDGMTHVLSEYRGEQAVVVAWFPRAFTTGCTIECKSLAENGDEIRKFEVAYFMASVDSLEDNIRFANATSVTLGEGATARVVEKEEADFPMLSDPTKEVATKYGVLNARGVASRWTFYIDKDGRIAAIDKMVRPETSAEDMVARLADIQVAMR